MTLAPYHGEPTRLDTLRLLLAGPRESRRSYDDKQLGARLVSWLCCKRTYWATDPSRGCLVCRHQ